MKKYGLRVLVGLFTLLLGLGAVWLLNVSNASQKSCELNYVEPNLLPKSEIEIKFKEFIETKDGILVDFEIINNSPQPVFYSAYPQDKSETPVHTLVQKKIDGQEIEELTCGTGLINYELKPGQSNIFRFSNLSFYWKKGSNIQIGFYFKIGEKGNFQSFWSENLPISESIASKLLKEQRLFKLKYGN